VADEADIVITSTGAGQPIFRRDHVHQFLQRRRNRPLFFIAIALPRVVGPEVNRLEGAFVYDIDDLQSVAASHMSERSKEAMQAEAIVRAGGGRLRTGQQAMKAAARDGDLTVVEAVQQIFGLSSRGGLASQAGGIASASEAAPKKDTA